jgi:hypothetical protein
MKHKTLRKSDRDPKTGLYLPPPGTIILPKHVREEVKRWEKTTFPGMVDKLGNEARARGGDPLVRRKTIWDIWTVQGFGFWRKVWMAIRVRFGKEVG